MSAQSASNVVAFAPAGNSSREAGGQASQSVTLLNACRDQLIQGSTAAFAEGLAQAQETLLNLADRAPKLDSQHAYLAAQRVLASRSQELLEAFRSRFAEQFDEGIEDLRGGSAKRAGAAEGQGELALVACEDFERDLAIGKLASRSAYSCSQQLTALEHRAGSLLGRGRINSDDNPLHPRALFAAFVAATRALQVEDEVDLILLQQFEEQAGKKLPGVYATINRQLAANDVLPDIPVGGDDSGVRLGGQGPAAPAGGGEQTRGAFAEAPSAGAAPQSTPAGLAGAAPAQDGDLVGRLLAGLQSLGSAHSAVAAGRSGSAAPPQSQARLLETLTGLQKARPQVQGDGASAGGQDILNQLRAEPSQDWSHPVDAMTLDIVAMLFDLIFDDPKVPSALHGEIGKLQLPVLKVALMDKGFFSNKRHPARRLLDTIAGAAVGLGQGGLPRVVAKVRVVVDAIVRGFDTDVQIFAVQTERLAEFLADEQGRDGNRVGDQGGRQTHEGLEASVEAELRRCLEDAGTPAVVRDFIDGLWRAVLHHTGRASGTAGEAWTAAVTTMDDLVWSVTPKQGEAERQRLLAMLPGLLERLQQGLQAIDRQGEWSEFFSALMAFHMRALRSADPAAAAEQAPVAQAHAVPSEQDSPATGDRATPPETPGDAVDAETADVHLRRARNLALGTWVEFRTPRGRRKKLRLSWVSGMRGVYLFTNADDENGMTIAVARLADYFRRGTARLVDD